MIPFDIRATVQSSMSATNPYSVLGLKPGASKREIKQAFRRLAMVWHPDRNPSPLAVEHFKRIRNAYEALQDNDHEEDDENDRAEATEGKHGKDIRRKLDISLEEAASGCETLFTLESSVPCEDCDGTGEAGLARSKLCQHCQGSGRVHSRSRHLEKCKLCDGKGYRSERICPVCDGQGKLTEQRNLSVKIPPGVLPGDELRLAGQGQSDEGKGKPGDLYLSISIKPHSLFLLEGLDLVCQIPVSAFRMLAGGAIEAPSLDGPVSLQLETGSLEERTICIAGRGFPARRHAKPGDLILKLVAVVPDKLNTEQRRLLLRVEQLLSDHLSQQSPILHAWEQQKTEYLSGKPGSKRKKQK